MKDDTSSSHVIHQFRYEIESWERLLSFQKEELIYFKNRLAELISNNTENDLLLSAEEFQEAFLAQDKVVKYLSEELQKQARLVKKELYPDGAVCKQMQDEQKKLRREFRKAEELFNELKNKFDQYLVDLY